MKTLYVMCGCPGSGKTTFAQKHLRSATYISRDEIRFGMLNDDEPYFSHENQVFYLFSRAVANALKTNPYGMAVADATHLNVRSRQKLLDAVEKLIPAEEFNVEFVFIDATLDICLYQNSLRMGRSVVPEDQMKSMYNSIEIPTAEERSNVSAIWWVKRF